MKQVNVKFSENFTAGGKAKIDVYNALKTEGVDSIDCFCNKGEDIKTKIINEIRKYHFIDKLKREKDIIVMQYPFSNLGIVNKKLIKLEKNKKIIIVIHDIESLRFNNVERYEDERKIFEYASYIIAHNEKMKSYLVKQMKIDCNKIFELELFDYIYNGKSISYREIGEKPYTICFAGNLSVKKSPFLYEIDKHDDLEVIFSLYGIGYDMKERKNILYNGSYDSESLVENITGDFGLIWDGEWDDVNYNPLKEYTKYNNPHKLSLYIASRLPVIVWEKSAVADFVKKNHIGYTIDTLDDIKNICCDKSEYQHMQKQIDSIRKDVVTGGYIKKAIKMISKEIERDKL